MKALDNYRRLVDRVDSACRRIQEAYSAQITCEKGCAGNCCRIHLSVFAVEAVSLATALKKLNRETALHIRQKAWQTNSFGPCPLLEESACLMYASRLIICRTHGLPMRTVYRGQRSVGVCRKNFRGLDPIPDTAVIELDPLNRKLATVNRAFMAEFSGRVRLKPRFTISEALLLDL